MDKSAIISRLQKEYNYSHNGAKIVANKLESLSGELREAFVRWWESGTIPNFTIEGYTIQSLIYNHGMNPIASFLTLDWLEREPEKALASLRKGHDFIS